MSQVMSVTPKELQARRFLRKCRQKAWADLWKLSETDRKGRAGSFPLADDGGPGYRALPISGELSSTFDRTGRVPVSWNHDGPFRMLDSICMCDIRL